MNKVEISFCAVERPLAFRSRLHPFVVQTAAAEE